MKIKGKIIFVVIFFIVLVGISLLSSTILGEKPAAADNPGAAADPVAAVIPRAEPMPELPNGDSFSFIKSVMALTFVLGLIFLAAYLFKRIAGIKTPGLRAQRVPIVMVGTLPLGDKKFLAVVEIQEKHYFIGISQGSINLLSELDLDLSALEQAGGEVSGHDFATIFNKARSLLHSSQRNPLGIKK